MLKIMCIDKKNSLFMGRIDYNIIFGIGLITCNILALYEMSRMSYFIKLTIMKLRENIYYFISFVGGNILFVKYKEYCPYIYFY